MLKVKLQYPISTLNDQLLLPAGAYLTEETLSALLLQKPSPYRTYPLLQYGSVKDDCLNFLNTPPYVTFFSDEKQIHDLLNILNTVHLSTPILQSLDYFKQNDFYTYAHILMVFALSTLLAKDLIPDDRACVRLSEAGPTHDIGKICVPLHILKKANPLSRTERGIIEHHAAAGYVLLSYYYNDRKHLACKVARDHHERKDGSGYPCGIPLEDPMVEIIAVSDIYDALIRPRPYRSQPYDNRTALEEITEMARQEKIGWDALKALVSHHRKSKPHYKETIISAEKRGSPPKDNVYGVTIDDE
jgi:HD-GYP domain-containing protein (c-di-GMP phosphodiesterase class II)